MTPSLEGLAIKAKELLQKNEGFSSHDKTLILLDTNPVFQRLRSKKKPENALHHGNIEKNVTIS